LADERPTPRADWRVIALLVLLTFGLRMIGVLTRYGIVESDVGAWRDLGRQLLEGERIFREATFTRSGYPPVWLYMSAGWVWLENLTGISFEVFPKMLISLADGGTAALIYALLTRQGIRTRAALGWALLFAINPVSIFDTCIHSAVDPLVFFLTVWALAIITGGPPTDRRVALVGLLLGTGTMIKLIPSFFFPLYALYVARQRPDDWRRPVIILGAFTVGPFLLTNVPFVLRGEWAGLIRPLTLAGIGGLADFGLMPVLQLLGAPIHGVGGHPGLQLPDVWLIDDALGWYLSRGKVLVTLKMTWAVSNLPVLIFLGIRRRWELTRLHQVVILMAYVLAGTGAAHYLMWVLPFAMIRRDRWVIVYSLLASLGQMLFYLANIPRLMIGPSAPLSLPVFDTPYLVAASVLWAFSLTWLIALIRQPDQPPSGQGAD
jgi:hypothetical protein